MHPPITPLLVDVTFPPEGDGACAAGRHATASVKMFGLGAALVVGAIIARLQQDQDN
jgi:hypothetical protein